MALLKTNDSLNNTNTVKIYIIGRCAIPSLERGLKTHQKHGTFPPSETEIIKILDFTRRGKSNNIAHRPIIESLYGTTVQPSSGP